MSFPVPAQRLMNLGLRGATLISRFALVFFLAKLLGPAEIGVYGLITATIGYGLMVVGLDFYMYTTREIINVSPEKRGALLKNQAIISAIAYLASAPLILALFWAELLPRQYALAFIGLLLIEHLSQELNRLLVALSKPLMASVILFIRQASWILVAVAVMALHTDARQLSFVLACWFTGALIAALVGIHTLARMGALHGWQHPIDWAWIKRGLKVVLPFLVATLALRAVMTVDRYWFEAINGLELLGVYVFFMSCAMTLMAFLDAALFSFAYPPLIRHVGDRRADLFCQGMDKLSRHTLGLTLVAAVAYFTLLPYVVHWLGHPLYDEHYDLAGWLFAAAALQSASMVPHFGLYAQGHDRSIIRSHLLALPVFGIIVAVVSTEFPIQAIPAGLCGAFAFILGWKYLAFRKFTPTEYRSGIFLF